MSLQGIQDAIVQGTNNLLSSVLSSVQISIQPNIDKTAIILDNVQVQFQALTNQSSGVISKVNVILDKISPIVDDLNRLEKSVESILNLLSIIVIAIIVVIFVAVTLWFFRRIWPILRGWTATPRSFDEVVRELTMSRSN